MFSDVPIACLPYLSSVSHVLFSSPFRLCRLVCRLFLLCSSSCSRRHKVVRKLRGKEGDRGEVVVGMVVGREEEGVDRVVGRVVGRVVDRVVGSVPLEYELFEHCDRVVGKGQVVAVVVGVVQGDCDEQ